jgi:quercetin dioxygenase-like cupin family protein
MAMGQKPQLCSIAILTRVELSSKPMPMNYVSSKFFAVVTAVALWGQPAGNIKIDSPQARVLVVTEQPNQPSALHEHPMNRVMIYLGTGQMLRTTPDGNVQRLEFKAGDVRWSPAEGPHKTEYIADHPIQIVEIELKNKPQTAVTMPAIDPLKADPKHYSLEFENDQVRVLRVRFGPHEKGVLHEHKLNHIVVYLTDQARGKAGEVRLDEPMTHTEENPLDYPVERVAIDLK